MIAPTQSRVVGLLRKCIPAMLIAVPLLYLAVDLVQFPVILNDCQRANGEITVETMVNERDKSSYLGHELGSYLGHEFYISLDAIEDSGYLDFVRGVPTALVIDVDQDVPSHIGKLTGTVRDKLENLSPTDAAALEKIVSGSHPRWGQIEVLPLHVGAQRTQTFPVDYLYIVGVKSQGSGDEQAKKRQAEILQDALRAAMAKGKTDHILNLIIPCLGVDPNNQKMLQFREWYPQLFAATQTARSPGRIYLSIYERRSDKYRADALTSLQEAWVEACSASHKQSVLVREELRLILVGAFVCLLASSLHVPITIKNFLIISTAFVGLGFGMLHSLRPFSEDWDAKSRLLVGAVGLLFLALAFPYIRS